MIIDLSNYQIEIILTKLKTIMVVNIKFEASAVQFCFSEFQHYISLLTIDEHPRND